MKEVSLELSNGNDEKVVMWVLDSFSTLVSKALASTEEKKSEYDSVISMLFDLNTSIIPIAICSSATTAGALNESTIPQSFPRNYFDFVLILKFRLHSQSIHISGFVQGPGFHQSLTTTMENSRSILNLFVTN